MSGARQVKANANVGVQFKGGGLKKERGSMRVFSGAFMRSGE